MQYFIPVQRTVGIIILNIISSEDQRFSVRM